MAAEKKVKLVAITRVGLGDGKVAMPGQTFEIADGEVQGLEQAGAATRVEVKKGE